jgi:hypothetical protein
VTREPNSPDTLLVATLAAMSRFSQSLREGTDGSALAMRVARCLEALADCSALAPALRGDCEQLASLWALLHPGATRPRPASTATRASAVVVPLRPLRSENARHFHLLPAAKTDLPS